MTSPSLGERKALFSGLKFFLAGFEEETENQFTAEIQAHDGQISERYNSKCTHVVVFNLTYGDPICVSARKGGKVLVTDSWVLDCLNTDTLVDFNNVLYGPLKDLDGIPGGEHLCMCLTGYQGLARKNIMRMVDMMGSKFSKPLISTSVTHLICYKFEGEKYELAKRTAGLMLVNHFWLENCLKAWTLLPESDYAQSGLEAETKLQTSAEDSEGNDTPTPIKTVSGRKSTGKQKMVSTSDQTPTEKGSVIADDNLVSEGFINPKRISGRLSLPGSGSGANEGMIPQIKNTLDTSVNNNMADEPPFEDFLLSDPGSQDRNSAQHDSKDESTHLFVEDDVSNLSCGRSSYQGVNKLNDEAVGEVNGVHPVNKVGTICDAMELMDVTAENGSKRRMSGAQVLATDATSPLKDNQSESPETKRRRRSQPGSKVEEVCLDKITRSPSEESKQLPDGIPDESLSCDFKQGNVCVEDSRVNHEALASCAGAEFSDNYLDIDMEDVITGASVPSSSPDKLKAKSDTGELLDLPDEMKEMLSVHDSPNCGNEEGIDEEEGCNTGHGGKRRAENEDCDSVQESEEVRDGRGALGNEGDKIDSEHNSPPKMSPSTVRSPNDDEKDVPAKKSKGKRSGNQAALAELAKSYNPNRGRKSTTKLKPTPAKKETLTKQKPNSANKENLTKQKPTSANKEYLTKERPTSDDKENLTANQINQKAPPKTVTKKPGVNQSCETSKVIPVDSRCFAVGGSTDKRDRLHSIVKILGGKVCKSRHEWRDEATHVILPDPLRRTEKFLAGAAAGRWILKPEYLEASSKAGKFVEEEPYEWYGEEKNDKGTISLQAPRKWRVSKATSGCGAFHGLRVLFYGECISPPLGTLKRAVKAGGGLVLATSPPYNRHFTDGVHFAIISPGIPQDDHWVKEFLKHNVACVLSDYFLDTVCHPSSSLEEHILYNTNSAVKAAHQIQLGIAQFRTKCASAKSQRAQHIKTVDGDLETDPPEAETESVIGTEDIACSVCRKTDDDEVMLLCGDDQGAGCGLGFHIHCCSPPLSEVPDEDWFCSNCSVS